MIDVMMGFDKEQAAQVRERLEHNDELLIYPSSISPKHIALEGDDLLECYEYVACRLEARTLTSAILAAINGDRVEFLRLYSSH